MADSDDRELFSRYEAATVGTAISIGGVSADPDDNSVTITMRDEDTQQIIFNRPAIRQSVGTYTLAFTPDDTARTGNYMLQWVYRISGATKTFTTYISIGESDPDYDSLPPEIKPIIDSVWMRMADFFDNPNGGPNLQVYRMTHFSRGRISQLAQLAVGRLNTMSQPYQTYTISETGQFPVAKWGALLEKALWIETIKHLRRSYVEQPMLMGENVTRHDRRDYLDRWGQILADETEDFKAMSDTFKIANMGLGRPAVLVTGGAYGNFRMPRVAGMAGRPRFYYQNW